MQNVDTLLIKTVQQLGEPTLEEVAKATNLGLDELMDIVHRLAVDQMVSLQDTLADKEASRSSRCEFA